MGLTPSDFFVEARFEPGAAAVLLTAAAWYAWAVRRARRQGRAWSLARTACFALAWLLVGVSVFSGLRAFAPGNFSAFAAQYIMVGLLAPALLALSAPVTLALAGSTRPGRGRRLESRPVRVLAHPLVTWTVFTTSVFVLFFSGLIGRIVAGGVLEQVVFAWMLLVGWLFLWPVVDADPRPQRLGYWPRILYLLLSFPVFTIVGMGLESQTSRVAAGIRLASLHLGAAVIWVVAQGVALAGAIWIFVQWLRADERRARSHDRASEELAARQLALWRASRDAAARTAHR